MTQITIDANHPALAGHFPGDPVVPGAVILSEVVAMAGKACAPQRVAGVRKAKFLGRLLPGQAFELELASATADGVKFTCRQHGEVVVRGRLALHSGAAMGGREAL